MKLYHWNSLEKVEQQSILRRPLLNNEDNLAVIKNIIQAVKTSGDQALKIFTKTHDGIELEQFSVTPEEIQCALQTISVEAQEAVQFAKQQIEKHHLNQLPVTLFVNSIEGVYCERQARPIERVGLYIPGGTAPLISTVLMLAIPAQIANCSTRILCTPPDKLGNINPHILVAASLCGINHIYKLGGAQAIAAMAYGTESIPKVDKIFGPGNTWVTNAKMFVSQDPTAATIDMPAGPSELLVIADHHANVQYVAADLLSQAEHGIDSQVMLVTTAKEITETIAAIIDEQLKNLPRAHIVKQSLAHSCIILVDSIEQAIEISNGYAPEHLILNVEHPENYITQITNAGAVFLGPWTPETLGDYVTGSNHVLPTNGYARSVSGLSIFDFIKFISFQAVNKTGLKKLGPYAEKLAELEGLTAHQQAVALRLKEKVTA